MYNIYSGNRLRLSTKKKRPSKSEIGEVSRARAAASLSEPSILTRKEKIKDIEDKKG
jgi:hypothetical protein